MARKKKNGPWSFFNDNGPGITAAMSVLVPAAAFVYFLVSQLTGLSKDVAKLTDDIEVQKASLQDFRGEFREFRRETRQDIKEIKASISELAVRMAESDAHRLRNLPPP